MSKLMDDLESKPWIEHVRTTREGLVLAIEPGGDRGTVRWFDYQHIDVVAHIPPAATGHVWILRDMSEAEPEGANPLSNVHAGVATLEKEDTKLLACVKEVIRSPRKWVVASDISIDGKSQPADLLRVLWNNDIMDRRGTDRDDVHGRTKWEYRLKDAYRREFSQYDPLNAQEADA